MLTTEKLIQLLNENDQAMKALLIHLELLKLVKLKNKVNPKLETTVLIDEDQSATAVPIEKWIDSWRALFNQLDVYKLSMGIGNKQNCIDRMKLFMEKGSDDVQMIFEATQQYINDCIDKNRLSKKPEFFILPQGDGKISNRDIRTGDLFEWIQRVLNGETSRDISIHNI